MSVEPTNGNHPSDQLGAYPPYDDRVGVAGHVSGLARDAARLVQDEVQLAKIEMTEKIDDAKQGVAGLGVAAIFLTCGLLTLSAAATLALGLEMDLWKAALIVGGVLTLVGVIAFVLGKNKLEDATDPVPHAAKYEAKHTRARLKEQFR